MSMLDNNLSTARYQFQKNRKPLNLL